MDHWPGDKRRPYAPMIARKRASYTRRPIGSRVHEENCQHCSFGSDQSASKTRAVSAQTGSGRGSRCRSQSPPFAIVGEGVRNALIHASRSFGAATKQPPRSVIVAQNRQIAAHTGRPFTTTSSTGKPQPSASVGNAVTRAAA